MIEPHASHNTGGNQHVNDVLHTTTTNNNNNIQNTAALAYNPAALPFHAAAAADVAHTQQMFAMGPQFGGVQLRPDAEHPDFVDLTDILDMDAEDMFASPPTPANTYDIPMPINLIDVPHSQPIGFPAVGGECATSGSNTNHLPTQHALFNIFPPLSTSRL